MRIKDIDFDRQVITIHANKEAKERTTLLPAPLIAPLLEHVSRLGTTGHLLSSTHQPTICVIT
ncbi:hypothetical protein FOT80_03095 [Serratia fonticola]|nr:hypothetical protein [Serratia fonticola]